jgi:biopolymer transport protein ExbB/biopolymer transport protein TolQ
MLIKQLLNIAEVVGTAVLYVLIVLSVVSLAITIERLVYFLRRRVDAAALGKALAGKLREKDLMGMRTLLEGSITVEAAVMLEALPWVDRGPDALAEVVAGALREKKKEYERGLVFLGTLGNNAPFVGLFGTVLGIVNSFRELAAATGGGGQMGNVMGGISEALVATAVGILVAIPAVVAFNWFSKQSSDIEDNVATLLNLLLAELKATHGPTHHGQSAVSTLTETPVTTSTAA